MSIKIGHVLFNFDETIKNPDPNLSHIFMEIRDDDKIFRNFVPGRLHRRCLVSMVETSF